MSVQLTKDADLMICELYAEYLTRRKSGISKSDARDFPAPAELQATLFPTWPLPDIDATISELTNVEFLKTWITGAFELTDSAVIYMEHRFKNGLKDVIDFLLKIRR